MVLLLLNPVIGMSDDEGAEEANYPDESDGEGEDPDYLKSGDGSDSSGDEEEVEDEKDETEKQINTNKKLEIVDFRYGFTKSSDYLLFSYFYGSIYSGYFKSKRKDKDEVSYQEKKLDEIVSGFKKTGVVNPKTKERDEYYDLSGKQKHIEIFKDFLTGEITEKIINRLVKKITGYGFDISEKSMSIKKSIIEHNVNLIVPEELKGKQLTADEMKTIFNEKMEYINKTFIKLGKSNSTSVEKNMVLSFTANIPVMMLIVDIFTQVFKSHKFITELNVNIKDFRGLSKEEKKEIRSYVKEMKEYSQDFYLNLQWLKKLNMAIIPGKSESETVDIIKVVRTRIEIKTLVYQRKTVEKDLKLLEGLIKEEKEDKNLDFLKANEASNKAKLIKIQERIKSLTEELPNVSITDVKAFEKTYKPTELSTENKRKQKEFVEVKKQARIIQILRKHFPEWTPPKWKSIADDPEQAEEVLKIFEAAKVYKDKTYKYTESNPKARKEVKDLELVTKSIVIKHKKEIKDIKDAIDVFVKKTSRRDKRKFMTDNPNLRKAQPVRNILGSKVSESFRDSSKDSDKFNIEKYNSLRWPSLENKSFMDEVLIKEEILKTLLEKQSKFGLLNSLNISELYSSKSDLLEPGKSRKENIQNSINSDLFDVFYSNCFNYIKSVLQTNPISESINLDLLIKDLIYNMFSEDLNLLDIVKNIVYWFEVFRIPEGVKSDEFPGSMLRKSFFESNIDLTFFAMKIKPERFDTFFRLIYEDVFIGADIVIKQTKVSKTEEKSILKSITDNIESHLNFSVDALLSVINNSINQMLNPLGKSKTIEKISFIEIPDYLKELCKNEKSGKGLFFKEQKGLSESKMEELWNGLDINEKRKWSEKTAECVRYKELIKKAQIVPIVNSEEFEHIINIIKYKKPEQKVDIVPQINNDEKRIGIDLTKEENQFNICSRILKKSENYRLNSIDMEDLKDNFSVKCLYANLPIIMNSVDKKFLYELAYKKVFDDFADKSSKAVENLKEFIRKLTGEIVTLQLTDLSIEDEAKFISDTYGKSLTLEQKEKAIEEDIDKKMKIKEEYEKISIEHKDFENYIRNQVNDFFTKIPTKYYTIEEKVTKIPTLNQTVNQSPDFVIKSRNIKVPTKTICSEGQMMAMVDGKKKCVRIVSPNEKYGPYVPRIKVKEEKKVKEEESKEEKEMKTLIRHVIDDDEEEVKIADLRRVYFYLLDNPTARFIRNEKETSLSKREKDDISRRWKEYKEKLQSETKEKVLDDQVKFEKENNICTECNKILKDAITASDYGKIIKFCSINCYKNYKPRKIGEKIDKKILKLYEEEEKKKKEETERKVEVKKSVIIRRKKEYPFTKTEGNVFIPLDERDEDGLNRVPESYLREFLDYLGVRFDPKDTKPKLIKLILNNRGETKERRPKITVVKFDTLKVDTPKVDTPKVSITSEVPKKEFVTKTKKTVKLSDFTSNFG